MRLPRVHVNGEALVHNYGAMRDLAPKSVCGAVVKANAYGVGLIPVVCRLWGAGCRLFYVASLDEGVALRHLCQQRGLSDTEIVVFHGYRDDEAPVYTRHQIIPVLKTPEAIQSWFSGDYGPAVLEWETGMHRCGLSGDPSLVASRIDPARLYHIMTHLAVADDPNHPLNAQQKESFAHICQFFPGVPTSIAASHGVFLGPAYHGDYVRVGLALYGGLDHPALRPVVQVHAPILEVRPVAAGESVGYGATYVASESRRVMTVGFGYADGYLRAFSNRGVAQLTGEDGTVFVLPVIGRVSMDVVTLDTSDVPESVLATTDEVIFYHPDQGGILAASVAAGTIPYELLTSLKSDLGRWVS